MKKILIITGGSKGIGKGIIGAYLADGFSVYSIARSANVELTKLGVTQIEFDLTQVDQIANTFQSIFAQIGNAAPEKITLINNAGTLGQIASLENVDTTTVSATFSLNLVAPFICCSSFINLTKNWSCAKTIINITSGAALKPYFGWSAYCSSKAALNMLSQTIALEQTEMDGGVKVLAIAPGVVDTDMQTQIRSTDEADFKDLKRFVSLKEDGGLNDATTVGQEIWRMDHDDSLVSGAILRVAGKN